MRKSDDLLTTGQAAERLGVSERQIRNLIKSGTLKAQWVGRWVIRAKDLAAESVVNRSRGRPSR